jgi:hypothetical protein
MKWFLVFALPCMVTANPIFFEIINEFQVDGSSPDCIEFRMLASPTIDTIYSGVLPLINTLIITPAGTSFVDTNIFLNGAECLALNSSFLNGPFWLPYNVGYAMVYSDSAGVEDAIYYPGHASMYPQHAPTPPANCSAAKYFAFVYDSLSWYHPWYWLLRDWYVDSTPTFGAPNDDYPGCKVSGHVYDCNLQPLAGAHVTASIDEWFGIIHNSQGHYKYCETHTLSDGSFLFDSLLPYNYYITVYADSYLPDTQYTDILCCTDPLNNLVFNLQVGISEHRNNVNFGGLSVFPNPFREIVNVVTDDAYDPIEIYDVTGELVMKISNRDRNGFVRVDGSKMAAGVYFLCIAHKKVKLTKL